MRIKKLTAQLLSLILLLGNCQPAFAEPRTLETTTLEAGVKEVDYDTMLQWAKDTHIISDNDDFAPEAPVKALDIFSWLMRIEDPESVPEREEIAEDEEKASEMSSGEPSDETEYPENNEAHPEVDEEDQETPEGEAEPEDNLEVTPDNDEEKTNNSETDSSEDDEEDLRTATSVGNIRLISVDGEKVVPEIDEYSETCVEWALNKGLINTDEVPGYDETKTDAENYDLILDALSENLDQISVLRVMWMAEGAIEPEDPAEHTYYFTCELHQDNRRAACWAQNVGIFSKEEEAAFVQETLCTKETALKYFYYRFHHRKAAFPITVDEFLQSCQNVVDHARINGYRYGSSGASNPTTDGVTSCDRLVAKALYDLGYTDQPRGGITVGNMEQYLAAWGFEESHNIADVKRGSIMLVRHQKHADSREGHYCHAFVVVDFDQSTWRSLRYDHGSDGKIRAVQPMNCGWGYMRDHFAVFNIPE